MTGDLTYKFGAGGVGFGAKGEVGFYSTVVDNQVKYGVYIPLLYTSIASMALNTTESVIGCSP